MCVCSLEWCTKEKEKSDEKIDHGSAAPIHIPDCRIL